MQSVTVGIDPYLVGSIAAIALAYSLFTFLLNWSQVLQGPILIQPIISVLSSLYSLDRLGALVILLVLIVGLAVACYTAVNLSHKENVGPFFALLLLMVTCSIGIVSSGDFLSLFLFWEGLSITAYGLVSFERRVSPSRRQ